MPVFDSNSRDSRENEGPARTEPGTMMLHIITTRSLDTPVKTLLLLARYSYKTHDGCYFEVSEISDDITPGNSSDFTQLPLEPQKASYNLFHTENLETRSSL